MSEPKVLMIGEADATLSLSLALRTLIRSNPVVTLRAAPSDVYDPFRELVPPDLAIADPAQPMNRAMRRAKARR